MNKLISKKDKKNSLNNWPTIAEMWKNFRPPLRPSKGELKIYLKYLNIASKKKDNLQILMFGATPEIRDLLANFKSKITIVDVNPEMVKEMNKLVKNKSSNEKIIYSNWLDIDFGVNKFDIIIGDQVLNNIKKDEWSKFFNVIKKSLKNDGFFISGFLVNPFKKRFTIFDLVKDYKKNKNWYKNPNNKFLRIFNLAFTDKYFWHPDKFCMIWPTVNSLEDSLKLNNLKLSDREMNFLGHNIHSCEPFYCYSTFRKKFEAILSKHFKIINSDINNAHPVYKIYRLYMLQNKK